MKEENVSLLIVIITNAMFKNVTAINLVELFNLVKYVSLDQSGKPTE